MDQDRLMFQFRSEQRARKITDAVQKADIAYEKIRKSACISPKVLALIDDYVEAKVAENTARTAE